MLKKPLKLDGFKNVSAINLKQHHQKAPTEFDDEECYNCIQTLAMSEIICLQAYQALVCC